MEYLWMTASILQQLLALQIAIIYGWQLSSSEKSLVGKKYSSIYFKDFTDFFYIDNYFFHILLRKAYAVRWAANRFVGSETPKHNAFKQVLKFKFHFEHFPRNTISKFLWTHLLFVFI